jgi:hypothetical protein
LHLLEGMLLLCGVQVRAILKCFSARFFASSAGLLTSSDEGNFAIQAEHAIEISKFRHRDFEG